MLQRFPATRAAIEEGTVAGGGVGLTNLRERLAALYGEEGRFTIESNAPRGVVATIDIPAGAAAMKGQEDRTAGTVATAGATMVAPNATEAAAAGWRRAWRVTSRTHSVWASIASRVSAS